MIDCGLEQGGICSERKKEKNHANKSSYRNVESPPFMALLHFNISFLTKKKIQKQFEGKFIQNWYAYDFNLRSDLSAIYSTMDVTLETSNTFNNLFAIKLQLKARPNFLKNHNNLEYCGGTQQQEENKSAISNQK
ncbi:CLUMA_CG000366, isoform A [Clunio marinus]|uniref:CLUMA_CG000366, isoform A n=1 Tax=Clunio marinus TaxID=568069 RepID=A0A1J1HEP0_9DIPT|nr:CLUMA_CG000366, isoform A [Clunio marinus]